MFVVDTNILVYAADVNAPGHRTCNRFVQSCIHRIEPWYLTWSILYEYISVTTNRRVLVHPVALAAAYRNVRALLASPSVTILQETSGHSDALGEVVAESPSVTGAAIFDCRIVAVMREHGVQTIYTRDAGFRRFPDLEVIDPLAP